MWHTYYAPRTVAEALELLARHGDACRIIAGGTDLILELERGVRKQEIVVDISRTADLDRIEYAPPAPNFGGAAFPPGTCPAPSCLRPAATAAGWPDEARELAEGLGGMGGGAGFR